MSSQPNACPSGDMKVATAHLGILHAITNAIGFNFMRDDVKEVVNASTPSQDADKPVAALDSSAINIFQKGSATNATVSLDDIPFSVRHGKIVVSICGGDGIHGIFPIVFLKTLRDMLKQRGLDIRDCIDLIGGTSTGGITALMFGRLGISLDLLLEEYANYNRILLERSKEEQKRISEQFKGRSSEYQRVVYSKLVKDIFQGNADVKLREQACNEGALLDNGHFASKAGRIPVFVVARADPILPTVICSYERNYFEGKTATMTIAEAAIATSASSLDLQPLRHEGCDYIDANTMFNNPSDLAKHQTRYAYGKDAFENVLISLGTGRSNVSFTAMSKDYPTTASAIRKHALYFHSTNSEPTHHRVEFDFYSSQNSVGDLGSRECYRFSPNDLRKIDFDDFKSVQRAIAISEKYLQLPEETARLNALAERIVANMTMRARYGLFPGAAPA